MFTISKQETRLDTKITNKTSDSPTRGNCGIANVKVVVQLWLSIMFLMMLSMKI